VQPGNCPSYRLLGPGTRIRPSARGTRLGLLKIRQLVLPEVEANRIGLNLGQCHSFSGQMGRWNRGQVAANHNAVLEESECLVVDVETGGESGLLGEVHSGNLGETVYDTFDEFKGVWGLNIRSAGRGELDENGFDGGTDEVVKGRLVQCCDTGFCLGFLGDHGLRVFLKDSEEINVFVSSKLLHAMRKFRLTSCRVVRP